jgi:hypothetical protein
MLAEKNQMQTISSVWRGEYIKMLSERSIGMYESSISKIEMAEGIGDTLDISGYRLVL